MIYPLFLILGDFIALLAAFSVAYIIRVQIDTRPLVEEIPAVSFIKVFFLLLPFWLLIFGLLGLYTKDVYEKRLSELGRLLIGSFIGILLVIGFDFVRDDTIFPARLVPVYGLIGSYLLLAGERNVLWLLRKQMFRYGRGLRNVMLIGSSSATKELAVMLSETDTSGYTIKAIVGSKTLVPKGYKGKHFSQLGEALDSIEKLEVDTIIQTELYKSDEWNERVLRTAHDNHVAYKFIPAHSEFFSVNNSVEVFNGFPMISIHRTPLRGWGRIVKRLTDVIGSLVGLIIGSPFILVCAFLIKITDPRGPVFFKHQRLTRYGTPFNAYKLRSMYWKYSTGAHASGKSDLDVFKEMGRDDLVEEFKRDQKVKDDPRVMPIGKFIRATSIDELPQLWNILKGELSLVGPRPLVKDELARYTKQGGSSLVLSVKSGLTGLWQVSGRSELSYDERVNLDLYYVQNWSFWLDLRIILKTFAVVIRKSGAR